MNPLSPELKQQVMDLLAQGVPVKEIATTLNVARTTIYTWRDDAIKHKVFRHDKRLQQRAKDMRAQHYTVDAIATRLGVPTRTIYSWLHNTDGEPMPIHHDNQIRRRVYELRAEGKSVRAISEEVSLPSSTVYHWLTMARNRAKTLLEKHQAELHHLAEVHADDPNLSAALLRLSRSAKAVLSGMSM